MIRVPLRTVPGMNVRESVTPMDISEQFIYDAGTGLLTRLSTNRPVGTVEHAGYLVAKVSGKTLRVHRMIWALVHGTWPEGEVDHINGVRTDNRLSNLRDVSKTGNAQNLRVAKAQSRTGILGVSWDKERLKFKAQITVNRRAKLVGRFDTAGEAREAYLAAKRRAHGTCTI